MSESMEKSQSPAKPPKSGASRKKEPSPADRAAREIARIHREFPPEESPEGLALALLDLAALASWREGLFAENAAADSWRGGLKSISAWIGASGASNSGGSWLSNPHLLWSFRAEKSAGSAGLFSQSHYLHDTPAPAAHALVAGPIWGKPAGALALWEAALDWLWAEGWLVERKSIPPTPGFEGIRDDSWSAMASFRPMTREEAHFRNPRTAPLLRSVIEAGSRLDALKGSWGFGGEAFSGDLLEKIEALLKRAGSLEAAKALDETLPAAPKAAAKRGV